MKPFLSVIVPCFNEVRFIERSLASILGNDYPEARMEVIVSDGGSGDGTRRILQALAAREPRLLVIDNAERITPVALNRAIDVSRGEIIVRFDAHAVMPPDYLRRLVDLLESSGADNVGGSIRTVARSQGPFSGPIAAVLGSRFGVGNSGFRTLAGESGPRLADTVFGGCWKRELFARIGGFNERLTRSQDLEFNLRIARAGGKILLDPQIVCDYYARADFKSFWLHNFSNGIWAVLPFAFSSVIPVRPRHLIPLAFVILLAASAILPFPWSVLLLALYATMCLTVAAATAVQQRRLAYLPLMPIALSSLHFAYGLGSVAGCFQLAFLKLRALRGTIRAHATRIEN